MRNSKTSSMYSRNGEDVIAFNYFNEKGTQMKLLMDIGARDGITFSNSKLLIENGWIGTLLEPHHEECRQCYANHLFGNYTCVHNIGISTETKKKFNQMFYTFEDFDKHYLVEDEKFSFLAIRANVDSMDILEQIDLRKYGVEMLCIEWNEDRELEIKYTEYCNQFGLRELHRNEENMIFAL
jgi:hypothetical protein